MAKEIIIDEERGEEYPIYTCKKGHYASFDFKCNDFKEYRPRKPKEQDTECDKCEYLKNCIEKGNYIDCTTSYGTRRHYECSRLYCLKRKELGLDENDF